MTLAASSTLVAACASHRDNAVLAAFEANLAEHVSATEALRQWCATRGIAASPQITAQFIRGHDEPPPASLRQLLGIDQIETPGYRHVRLSCGAEVLSEAHNWYVPGRLTPEMNRALAETDTPFGKVAASLHFTREPLQPPSEGNQACPDGIISMHRALLRLPDGRPLALVVECYTEANLRR